ncbi:MAG: phospho-N-acetylmuramoyl-pentapeptide-transferase [Mollicutes bacterium]|nr:phospho-N-acetylmuramoyl-pentapeptide-transferase [Mollicutes bacterium]
MLILTKSVMVMMISFIISTLFAIFTIPTLKKLKADQRLSIYLEDVHQKKAGTPTMGGIIFIVPTILIFLLFYFLDKINITYNFLIIIITFISYGLLGFIDDYLIIKRNNNKGLSESTKLLFQLLIALIFFYLFMRGGNEPLLWIQALNIKLDIGWIYGLFILLVLVASSNAVNITDGLDGLAGGLSVLAFLAFGILSWAAGWLEGYEEIALFCFTLIGALLAFLLFNVHPAKVFMGDTGSLALGATLGAIAIVTRHEILLIVIGIAFVIETMSCVIQRIYYKFTKKRFFLMTPIHHSFEKKGWEERDIVKLFWVIGLIGAMLSLIYGVWW